MKTAVVAPDPGMTISLVSPRLVSTRLFQETGGIIGDGLVRHSQGDIRQSVTIIIRREDAKDLGPAIMGRLNAIG
jgi:hypothetical protein